MDHNIFGDYNKGEREIEKRKVPKYFNSYKSKRAEEIFNLLNHIDIPSKDSEVFIVKRKTGEYLNNIFHMNQILLAQMLSEDVFPDYDYRYTLLPMQDVFDAYMCETDFFKEILSISGTAIIQNRELITSSGKLFSDPVVVEKDNKLSWSGESVDIEIDKESAFDTLISSKIIKPYDSTKKYRDVLWKKSKVVFEYGVRTDQGYASARSMFQNEGKFVPMLGKPTVSDGFVVFKKIKT